MRSRALLACGVGFVLFFAFGLLNRGAYPEGEHGWKRDFFLAYQVGYVFWAAIPIGSMALLLLGYMTSASWALVFRRIFQASIRTLPLIVFLFAIGPVVGLWMEEESPFWWV